MKKVLILLLLGLAATLYAGTVLDSTITISPSGNVMSKMYYEWNDKYQATKYTYYSLNDNQLKLYYISRYEYDSQHRNTLSETVYYDNDTIQSGARIIYEYNTDTIVKTSYYNIDYKEWKKYLEYEYVYDQDGNRIQECRLRDYNGTFIFDELTTYTYDNGILIADTLRDYNQVASAWEGPNRLHVYEYDSEGRKTVMTWYYYKTYSQTWEYTYKETYTYEQDGKFVSTEYWSYREDAWEPISKSNTQYNDRNGIVLSESYTYTDGNWVGTSRTEYNYNSDFSMNSIYTYSFTDNDWQYKTKMEYEYNTMPNVTICGYYNYDNGWEIQYTAYNYFHYEESAIDEVSIDTKFDVGKPAYDMQGRLVDIHSYHGIVIQNGHKFLR